jgi:hypothetical protein
VSDTQYLERKIILLESRVVALEQVIKELKDKDFIVNKA